MGFRRESHSSPSPMRKSKSSPNVAQGRASPLPIPESKAKAPPQLGWKPIGGRSPSPEVAKDALSPNLKYRDAKTSLSPLGRGELLSPPRAYQKSQEDKPRFPSEKKKEHVAPSAMPRSTSPLQRKGKGRIPPPTESRSRENSDLKKGPKSPARKKKKKSFDDWLNQGLRNKFLAGDNIKSNELPPTGKEVRRSDEESGKRQSASSNLSPTSRSREDLDRSRSPGDAVTTKAHHSEKRMRRPEASPHMKRPSPEDNRSRGRSSSRRRFERGSLSPQARNGRRDSASEFRNVHQRQSPGRRASPGVAHKRGSPSPHRGGLHKTPAHENTRVGRTQPLDSKKPAVRDEIQMKLLSMAGLPASESDQRPSSRSTKRPPSPTRGLRSFETGGGGRGGGGGTNANLEPLARRSPIRREGERNSRRDQKRKAGAEVDPTFLQSLNDEQWMKRPRPSEPGPGSGRRSRSKSGGGRRSRNGGSQRGRSRSFDIRGGFEGENYISGERRQEIGLSPDHMTSPLSKRRRVVMMDDGRALDGELQNGEGGPLLQDKKQRKEKKDKKRKKKKKKVSSSSDSDSDSSDEESKKKKKKVKKDKKERKKKAPMTKEEWEKKQSVVRREFDEDTGRVRLIKGDGEVLEECVSRERQQEINRAATRADGASFQRDVARRTR